MGHSKEDYDEREFKRFITGRILDILKQSSKTRSIHISGAQLKLLKIFFEVMVAPKYGPLARTENQAMS